MGGTWVGSGGQAPPAEVPTGAVALESGVLFSIYAKVTELDLKNDRRSRLWIPLLT
jgi:hypothetical protein